MICQWCVYLYEKWNTTLMIWLNRYLILSLIYSGQIFIDLEEEARCKRQFALWNVSELNKWIQRLGWELIKMYFKENEEEIKIYIYI